MGKGWRAIGREYEILGVRFRLYINGKYQEDLESSEGTERSSEEESSMGDF